MTSSSSDSDDFVRLLTECQSRLYAYIKAMLPDFVTANEVMSATNLTLWRKSADFRPGTDFPAWATRVAYFEVLAYQKRRNADRHIFTGELLEQVSEAATAATEDINQRRLALNGCLDKLSVKDRELIGLRYRNGLPVQAIAESKCKAPSAISQALYRIRCALANCIERTLGREGIS